MSVVTDLMATCKRSIETYSDFEREDLIYCMSILISNVIQLKGRSFEKILFFSKL